MKKITAFFLLVSCVSYASPQTFPVKIEALTVIDVANTNGHVILEYKNWTDNVQNPKVTVIEEKNGFTCEISKVKHIGSYERPSYPSENTYQIYINWQPGADLSNCLIQINHPDYKDSLVRLEMNY